jgi:2-keto-4-pentenoate hydratase/2-oxohepta-3-ene-1,7-dioic acid hydratase in catechol pathway
LRVARIQVDGAAPVAAVERDGILQPLAHDVPALIEGAPPGDPFDAVAGAKRLAPVVPRKVVAIGLNYLDHIREAGLETPQRPLVFAKFPSSVIGADEPIRLPLELTQRVDWEVELAVVIGARARNVAIEDALGHVYGYTVANDVSARDLQFADGQWVRAKSLDTFCPLGPKVVELDDPQNLKLQTRVNGEVMQDSSTKEMIFGVAELISFCSHSFALEPGDVVLTGTPAHSRPMEPGDTVEVEIDGIGRLTNTIAEWDVDLSAAGEQPAVSANTLHVALAIPEEEAERMVERSTT